MDSPIRWTFHLSDGQRLLLQVTEVDGHFDYRVYRNVSSVCAVMIAGGHADTMDFAIARAQFSVACALSVCVMRVEIGW